MSTPTAIIDLETRFWQAMKDNAVATASALIAEDCRLSGPHGIIHLSPKIYAQHANQTDWRLTDFTLEDTDVMFPAPDTAVITYKVHQQAMVNGKPLDLRCADSSVWVKQAAGWRCVLHTESLLT